jgi:cell wall-associated NlpC family hydrolase
MKKMKKQVKILILVAVLFIVAGITVLAATIGKVNSSYVRLREKASTESEILDVLMEGDQVEILAEEGDWYKISAKGHTGYISKAFVTKNGETPAPTENQTTENNTTTETPAEKPATQTATVTTKIYKVAETTSVYILPILSSDTIGTINAGEGLDLINSTGLWGYVKSNNVKGWVRIDKLSAEEVTQTVEVPAEQTEEQAVEQKEETPAEQPAEQKQEEQPAEQPTEQKQEEKPAEETAEQKQEEQPAEQPAEQKQEEQPAQAEQQNNYAEKTMYVCETAINIRQEANTTSEVVSGATLNTAYTVVGEENDWYKVKIQGGYGYIRKDLLSDKKTEETSRSNETDRTQAAAATQAQTTAVESTKTNTSTKTESTKKSSKVTGEDVAAYAQQFLGCSYVYAAAGPNSFDCSGLTMYVYKHFGYNLSHSSKVQATQGVAVTGDLQPGDILVFSNDGKQVGHVGLYIGNDKFIHASDYSTGVIISNLHDSWNINKYWGARRIIQ